jgi:hypothetical protein
MFFKKKSKKNRFVLFCHVYADRISPEVSEIQTHVVHNGLLWHSIILPNVLSMKRVILCCNADCH